MILQLEAGGPRAPAAGAASPPDTHPTKSSAVCQWPVMDLRDGLPESPPYLIPCSSGQCKGGENNPLHPRQFSPLALPQCQRHL